jgi:biopolymer transport protein ExbB
MWLLLGIFAAQLLAARGMHGPTNDRPRPQRSMLQLFFDGGWLMVPIVGGSVVVTAIALRQRKELSGAQLIPPSLSNLVLEFRGGRVVTEEMVRQGCRESPSPFGEMLLEVFHLRGRSLSDISTKIDDVVSFAAQRLLLGNAVHSYVGRTATFLGLLGTVVGMIAAFSAVAELDGVEKREVLASGISRALVTTMAGITVALIAGACEHYYSIRIQHFAIDSYRLLSSIEKDLSEHTCSIPTPQGPHP